MRRRPWTVVALGSIHFAVSGVYNAVFATRRVLLHVAFVGSPRLQSATGLPPADLLQSYWAYSMMPPFAFALRYVVLSTGVLVLALTSGLVAGAVARASLAILRQESWLRATLACLQRDGAAFTTYGLLWLPFWAVGVAFVSRIGSLDPEPQLYVPLFLVTTSLLLVNTQVPLLIADGLGVRAALEANAWQLRHRPQVVVAYAAAALPVVTLGGIAASSAPYPGYQLYLAALTGSLFVCALGPLVLFRAALYCEASLPAVTTTTSQPTVGEISRRSVRELRRFVRRSRRATLAAGSVVGLAFVEGWRLGAGGSFSVRYPERSGASLFVTDVVHDGTLAVERVVAGSVAGGPSVVLTVADTMATAETLAGVSSVRQLLGTRMVGYLLELPASVVTLALSLSLAVTMGRLLAGRTTPDVAAERVERLWYATLGLAPVYVVAAAIRAFVVPAS